MTPLNNETFARHVAVLLWVDLMPDFNIEEARWNGLVGRVCIFLRFTITLLTSIYAYSLVAA